MTERAMDPAARPRGIFVTGTGTDVGKTYVTALLVKRLREQGINVGYFKAALSGAALAKDGRPIPGDAAEVYRTAGIPGDPAEFVPYIYREAFSPHLAARLEGRPVEPAAVEAAFRRAKARFPFVVAEGSGGIVCPLRDGDAPWMLTDVIRLTGFPLLIVTPSGLGSINAAVLTAEYARTNGFRTAGFLLNGFRPGDTMHEDNRRMIERLTGLPVLACVEKGAQALPLDPSVLLSPAATV